MTPFVGPGLNESGWERSSALTISSSCGCRWALPTASWPLEQELRALPALERDPDLAIAWPLETLGITEPQLAEKYAAAPTLAGEVFP